MRCIDWAQVRWVKIRPVALISAREAEEVLGERSRLD
jgi:uncharacterized protein YbdZ (MbtH family)